MKALVLMAKNSPLEVREVAQPVAGAEEAIVKVYAAALNHRDVYIQRGMYAGLRYPIVPGSDGAGVVVGAAGSSAGAEGSTAAGLSAGAGGGPAAGAAAWIGKEVIINPALFWGDQSAYQDPAGFKILGLPDDGTLAEYVRVPVNNLVEKPAHLGFEEAAALPLAGVTAWRAVMNRAQLQPGERILITGIGGGVALFVLQFALAAGARVYVSSGSAEKLSRALALGASGGVNYREVGWVESLRSMAGNFDVIVDGAAGDAFSDLLDLAMPGGRLVLYGATKGNPSNVVARRIFWKQLNVLGSTMGNQRDFGEMAAFVSRHKIRPVVDKVFPFAEGEAAFRRMEDGEQFGKIVLKIK